MLAVHVKEADAGLAAIFLKRFKLETRVGVNDGQRAIFGGDGVVHDGEGEIGAADFAAFGAQAGEGLRGSAFVDEVAVDIDERGLAGLFVDDVTVPNFLVESFRRGHRDVVSILALWGNVGTFAKRNGSVPSDSRNRRVEDG